MRYIDADKLIDDLEHDIAIDQYHILYVGIDMREKELIQFDKDCKQNCIDMLSKAPTADVRENVKAHWIDMKPTGDNRFMCSRCKGKEKVPTIMGEPIVWDYCPNCGAEMKVDNNAKI